MPGSHSKLSKSNGESHNGHGRQVVRQILPTLQHEEMENRLRLEHAMQYDASRYYNQQAAGCYSGRSVSYEVIETNEIVGDGNNVGGSGNSRYFSSGSSHVAPVVQHQAQRVGAAEHLHVMMEEDDDEDEVRLQIVEDDTEIDGVVDEDIVAIESVPPSPLVVQSSGLSHQAFMENNCANYQADGIVHPINNHGEEEQEEGLGFEPDTPTTSSSLSSPLPPSTLVENNGNVEMHLHAPQANATIPGTSSAGTNQFQPSPSPVVKKENISPTPILTTTDHYRTIAPAAVTAALPQPTSVWIQGPPLRNLPDQPLPSNMIYEPIGNFERMTMAPPMGCLTPPPHPPQRSSHFSFFPAANVNVYPLPFSLHCSVCGTFCYSLEAAVVHQCYPAYSTNVGPSQGFGSVATTATSNRQYATATVTAATPITASTTAAAKASRLPRGRLNKFGKQATCKGQHDGDMALYSSNPPVANTNQQSLLVQPVARRSLCAEGKCTFCKEQYQLSRPKLQLVAPPPPVLSPILESPQHSQERREGTFEPPLRLSPYITAAQAEERRTALGSTAAAQREIDTFAALISVRNDFLTSRQSVVAVPTVAGNEVSTEGNKKRARKPAKKRNANPSNTNVGVNQPGTSGAGATRDIAPVSSNQQCNNGGLSCHHTTIYRPQVASYVTTNASASDKKDGNKGGSDGK